MYFEPFVSYLKTLLCKVRICFGAVKSSFCFIGMISTCISRQFFSMSAQHPVYGGILHFPRQIPQGYINRTDSHSVLFSQERFCLVVKQLSMGSIFSNKKPTKALNLLKCSWGNAHILPCDSYVGFDSYAKYCAGTCTSWFVERTHRETKVMAHIFKREPIFC